MHPTDADGRTDRPRWTADRTPVLEGRTRPGDSGRPEAVPDAGGDGTVAGRGDSPLRAELRRLDAVNGALRAARRELVDVATPAGIEAAVDRLADAAPYGGATLLGRPDRWQLPTPGPDEESLPPEADREPIVWRDRTGVPAPLEPFEEVPDPGGGAWALVPVRSGTATHPHLVVATDHPGAFGDRELSALARFGGTLGRAIEAAADRRLLRSEAVTELTIEAQEGLLVALARGADCRLSVDSLASAGDGVLAHVRPSGADAARVVEAATGVEGINVSPVGDATVEVTLSGRSAVVPLSRAGANVRSVAVGGPTPVTAEAVVEVPPGTDVRALFDRVREHAPGARLAAKRERDRPPATDGGRPDPDGLDGGSLDALTDRQAEALEVAYRSGYFEWPRERTGEEIAGSIGVSQPTFHQHLRAAERTVLSELFDARG